MRDDLLVRNGYVKVSGVTHLKRYSTRTAQKDAHKSSVVLRMFGNSKWETAKPAQPEKVLFL